MMHTGEVVQLSKGRRASVRQMELQRKLVKAVLKSFQKRIQPKKHYVFVIEVHWFDRNPVTVRRSHEEFFIFQCRLTDKFPLDCDQINGLIPALPGRKFLRRANTSAVAKKRVPQLQTYIDQLLRLPEYISQCDLVHKFFTPTLADYKLADLQSALTDTSSHSREAARTISDGSDGEEEYEDYITAVMGVIDYLPNLEDENESIRDELLSFCEGETLLVLSLDCPSGFWQARNADGDIGYIPCRYVTLDGCEMRPRANSKLGRRLSINTTRQRSRGLKRSINSTDCLFTGTFQSSGRYRCGRSLSPESYSLSTNSTATLLAQDDTETVCHVSSPHYRSRSMSCRSLIAPHVTIKEPSSSPVFRVPEEDRLSCDQEISPEPQEQQVASIDQSGQLLQVTKDAPLEKSASAVLRSAIMDVITQLDVEETGGQDNMILLPSSSHTDSSRVKDNGHTDFLLRDKPVSPQRTDRRSSRSDSFFMDSQSLDSAYASESGQASGRLDSPGRFAGSVLDIDAPGSLARSTLDINIPAFEQEQVEAGESTTVVEGEPYRATEAYNPKDNTCLIVEEGELVVVTAKLDDGWWCGHSCNSGKAGWFPAWLVEKA